MAQFAWHCVEYWPAALKATGWTDPTALFNQGRGQAPFRWRWVEMRAPTLLTTLRQRMASLGEFAAELKAISESLD